MYVACAYPPSNGMAADTAWLQTKVADLVQIAPGDFAKKSMVAIEDNINKKFANKVSLVLVLLQTEIEVWWFLGGFFFCVAARLPDLVTR